VTTSGFFNTSNPAPDDLKSAAEILAEALAAAAAVAGDSEDAAEAAAEAQASAASAAGAATQAADTLIAVQAASEDAGAAAAAASASAAEADERATAASQAVTDATTQATLAADHVSAAQAARDLARVYRDNASEYAVDAAASADAATSSAASAAALATEAGAAAAAAGLHATAAADAREAAQAAAGDAAEYATAASGFALAADGHVAEASDFAHAAHGSAQDAAASVSQADVKATQAANAAAAAEGSAATASGAATVATNAAAMAGTKAGDAASYATAAAESAADAAAAAEAASGGGIKVSVTDTTPELLDTSITISGGLTKTITNPGANERLTLGLSVATTSAQGAMSGADKAKLDGLPAASSIATKTYADNAAAAAVAAVIDAAPAELDTLREIAEHLADAEDTTAGLIAAVALKADKTYVDAEIAELAGAEHSHDFAELTNRPTSLVGYGITDAAPSTHVGAGGLAHALATPDAAGFISAADKVKLNGITAGAQPNAVTVVFGRQGAVAATSGDYKADQITNTPAGNLAATTVQAAINELDTEKATSVDVALALAEKADAAHTHSYADLTGTLTAATAAPGDNSTAVATTEFVQAAVIASTAGVASFNMRTGAVTLTAADVTGPFMTNSANRTMVLSPGVAAAGTSGGRFRISATAGSITSGGNGGFNGGALDLFGGDSSGGIVAANGGAVTIKGGVGRWTGVGGSVSVIGGESSSGLPGPRGGSATVAGGNGYDIGGAVSITGGMGVIGVGGDVSITGGSSTTGLAGAVNVSGGIGGTDQKGGDVVITPGPGSGSGDAGAVRIILADNGNMIISGLKASPAGLPSGTLWSDSGTLKVVP